MPQPKVNFSIAEVARIPPVLTAPALSSMPFRLMHLPVELRVQVYAYLVVVGNVFYSPQLYNEEKGHLYRDYPKQRQLDLSILRVSKATHEEAAHLYLTTNTFVLPRRWLLLRPFDTSNRAARSLFADAAPKKIKHIALMLDSTRQEWLLAMCRGEWDKVQAAISFPSGQLTAREIFDFAQTKANEFLEIHRDSMLTKILEFKVLQSIRLNITNAYYSTESCRMLYLSWDRAFRNVKHVLFVVQNSRDSADVLAKWKRQALLTKEELNQQFHIEFVVDYGPEAFTAAT